MLDTCNMLQQWAAVLSNLCLPVVCFMTGQQPCSACSGVLASVQQDIVHSASLPHEV